MYKSKYNSYTVHAVLTSAVSDLGPVWLYILISSNILFFLNFLILVLLLPPLGYHFLQCFFLLWAPFFSTFSFLFLSFSFLLSVIIPPFHYFHLFFLLALFPPLVFPVIYFPPVPFFFVGMLQFWCLRLQITVRTEHKTSFGFDESRRGLGLLPHITNVQFWFFFESVPVCVIVPHAL